MLTILWKKKLFYYSSLKLIVCSYLTFFLFLHKIIFAVLMGLQLFSAVILLSELKSVRNS